VTAPHVIIVVPAYNEAQTIADVVTRLCHHYSDIVVVDDGSTDDTAVVAATLPARVVRHPVNRGQGAALQTGIDYALARGADTIVTFDSDGQHDPADIEALLEPVHSGACDVALGSRFLGATRNMPWTRRLVLQAGVLFTRIVSRIRVTDVHNGLRAFNRPAAKSLRITLDRMAHASEILDQIQAAGWRYQEVPVTIHYTDYSLAKGQDSWNAIRIACQVVLERLGL
jgi:glycosyltransferase involved in cell wall biosynthesis